MTKHEKKPAKRKSEGQEIKHIRFRNQFKNK